MKKYDIVVVGGGAAGMFAAGKAAQSGLKVLLVEKMNRLGRKLLITGKGRCNITNQTPVSQHLKKIFPQSSFLKPAYGNFFVNDFIDFLKNYGVEVVVERGDRVFPISEKSSDVVNALITWCKTNGVDIKTETILKDIKFENSRIANVDIENNLIKETINCKAVIICTGGLSYPATGCTGDGYYFAKKAGHKIVRPLPALVPLETLNQNIDTLQGLSLKNVNVSLWVNARKVKSEFGEMLFTHFGLSGPIILTLSRFVVAEIESKNKVVLSIDLKPALDDLQLDRRLLRDIHENSKKSIRHLFKLWLPSSMIGYFLQELAINASTLASEITAQQRKQIRLLMKNLNFEIKSYRPFEEAIITSGGVSLEEISSKTMQSKIINGLFFAGEVIDLDADTGGFNLQIAWSTAWLAAQSAVKFVEETN